MSKKQVSIEVSENTYDLCLAAGAFCVAAYDAAKDGFQPLQDVPAVLTAAMVNLIPQFNKVDEVMGELAEDKVAFVSAVVIGLKAIIARFV